MLTNPLSHFVIGAIGSLLVFMLFTKLAGTKRFSFPSVILVVGVCCAVLAQFLSPWATPVVVALYAAANGNEWRQERAAARRLLEKHRGETP